MVTVSNNELRLVIHRHYRGGRYLPLAVAERQTHNGDVDVVYVSLGKGRQFTRPLNKDSRHEDSWTETVVWPDGVLRARFIEEELLSEIERMVLRDTKYILFRQ